ncbi:MAG: polysulfide reductase NrfD [Burkholderiales bacterium]|jgi:formate-dependent nitrite reductase membrane component NrfD|nr:polysulfide reductase NrfD [Burkholderiales bacterium]
MHELIVNRRQPEADPVLYAWKWEIPIDLFFAAAVAGMMMLGGLALARALRNERFPVRVHAPLLAFGLVHICLIALFLDLSHKLYVWRLYLTLQPAAPMSWGSWVLTGSYVLLAATALVDLPARWPWLARRLPLVARVSVWLGASRTRLAWLAWANMVFGLTLALYTGVLLATMVARPLWNSMVLPPLFLASGLASGAAIMALAARFVPLRAAAPAGFFGGLVNALIVPAPGGARSDADAGWFTRAALVFLVAQAVLLALLAIGLATSGASQAVALQLIWSGAFAAAFWSLVVVAGIALPVLLLAGARRLPAFATPVALVLLLAGGLALRWVLVDAGQASRFLSAAGL